MADKQRELPSWMGKMQKGGHFTKKVTVKTKKAISRVTIYLMNENELVQSAVAFGNTEDRICNVIPGFTEKVLKTEQHLEDGGQEGIEGPLDLLCARTCVSESYLDTTELETLPFGNDQGLQSGNQNCNSTLPKHPDIVPDDDDALKLVREIFFK